MIVASYSGARIDGELGKVVHAPGTLVLPEKLRSLLEYWCARRRGHDIPHRRDIDPIHIPSLLANVSLFQIDGARFRFRIAGRAIVEAYGVEPRGRYLDEFIPLKGDDPAIRAYRMAVEQRRPVLARSNILSARNVWFPLTRLVLPLAGDDGSVAFVLAGLLIEDGERAECAPLGPGTKASRHDPLLAVVCDP